MKHSLDPSHFRKIVVSVIAGLLAIILFVAFFAVSYLIFPPSIVDNDLSNTLSGPPSVGTGSGSAKPDILFSHIHAAFLIFINGKLLDLSDSRYQNQDMRIHFENGDGFTLHKHDRSTWLGPFFESLNMTLADNCLTLANGTSYCSNFDSQITFWINGNQNDQFQHYEPKDNDRVLLSYGRLEDVYTQLDYLNNIDIDS